ncbi:hypothetical protein SLE2022_234630 [Rubroshorea leprosula]
MGKIINDFERKGKKQMGVLGKRRKEKQILRGRRKAKKKRERLLKPYLTCFMDPELYTAAMEGKILELVEAFEKGPADRNFDLPVTCIQHCHQNVARILVDKNTNITYAVNKKGKSVLYLAATAGYADLVRHIMENPWVRSSGEERLQNKSPVHAALNGRNIGYLEGETFLLEKFYAAAYQRDRNGYFPIHIASNKGYVNIIEEFLWHCPDSRELLTRQGHRRVNLLVRKNDGLSALDIADGYNENKGSMASFPQQLTRVALRLACAKQCRATDMKNRRVSLGQRGPSKSENYKDKVDVILLASTLIMAMTFSAGVHNPWRRQQLRSRPRLGDHANGKDVPLIRYLQHSSYLALPLLGVALVTMSIAFMAGLYLVSIEKAAGKQRIPTSVYRYKFKWCVPLQCNRSQQHAETNKSKEE